jgi:hypothetical protein
MAETVLVRSDLTPEMIAGGRALLRALDSAGLVFDAAFWLLDEDHARWRLVLSSRSVRTLGSRKLYEKVGKILDGLHLRNGIWIGMVSIVDHKAPVVEALRRGLGATTSVDGTKLGETTVGSDRIAGCVLYRLSTRQTLLPNR